MTPSFKNTLLVPLLISLLVPIGFPVQAKEKQPTQMMKIGDQMVSLEIGNSFTRAQQLISSKEYDQAAAILKSLVESAPNIAPVRYKYGFVLLQQGKDADALLQARKCTEIMPSFAGGWSLVGEASMNLHKDEEARAAFEKSLALEPNGDNADVVRDRLSELNGQSNDAPVEMTSDPKIDEQNRINMKVNQALALCSNATRLFGQKQYELGLQACRDALKIAADATTVRESFVTYLNNYAAVCVGQQKLEQAEDLMKQAIALQKDGGVPTNIQLTTLNNYKRLLGFTGRSAEAADIESQINSLSGNSRAGIAR